MVIYLFFTAKLIVLEVETGILCNNSFARSSSQCFNCFLLYTVRSVQLNMNGCMREQECIQMFNFKYAHALANDLLSIFSN